MIDDPQRGGSSAEHVTHVVLCSGKFYYDLLEERKKRVQLGKWTPSRWFAWSNSIHFPTAELGAVLDRYEGAHAVLGAGRARQHGGLGPPAPVWTGRHAVFLTSSVGQSGSGSPVVHAERHQAIIDSVFKLG